jgi:hypothetical protein
MLKNKNFNPLCTLFVCLFICLYYNRNTHTVQKKNLFIKSPTYIVLMTSDSLVIIINIPHRKKCILSRYFRKCQINAPENIEGEIKNG